MIYLQTLRVKSFANKPIRLSAWKVFKYGVFSGPYFPAFRPEKTLYLDTFHAVIISDILSVERSQIITNTWCND